jgi:uncharacterized protein (TIGR03437 family)
MKAAKTLGLFLFAFLLMADTVNYSYDSAGRLIRAAYGSGKSVLYSYDYAGNLLRRLVISPQPGPAPSIPANGVVNAASDLGGPVAPGEIVSFYGTGVGPAVPAGVVLMGPGGALFDNFVSNTSVLFDGIPSPLSYVSPLQTNAIVPFEVAGKSTTQLQIMFQGRLSTPVTLPVAPSAPGLFSFNQSGTGPGAILNQDLSGNSASNPAAQGSVVVLFATGAGQTTPTGVDGLRSLTTPYPMPVLKVSVTIGGQPALLDYAGNAPTLVAGVLQVNAHIPPGTPSGPVPVVLTVGSASSQPNLTVAVQ